VRGLEGESLEGQRSERPGHAAKFAVLGVCDLRAEHNVADLVVAPDMAAESGPARGNRDILPRGRIEAFEEREGPTGLSPRRSRLDAKVNAGPHERFTAAHRDGWWGCRRWCRQAVRERRARYRGSHDEECLPCSNHHGKLTSGAHRS